jgi:hypothetical protein
MQTTATAGILRHRERIVGGLAENGNCKSWQVLVTLGTTVGRVMTQVVRRRSLDFDSEALDR